MMWSNPLLPFVVNSLITEYDIRRGNTSVMRTFNLASEDEIAFLNGLPKKERNIRVGLLQRERPGFAEALERGFDDVVRAFLKENMLDQDTDIVAIRRDAVFVVNRPIETLQVGEYVTFVKNDQYRAYLHLNEKVEMFFRSEQFVDAKHPRYDIDGFIRDDEERARIVSKLEPGILSFIEETIEVMESCNFDRRRIYRFLSDFCKFYKQKELDIEYYREFNREAKFRIHTFEGDSLADFVTEDMLGDIDISYNYLNVIIPILQSVVR